MVFSFVVFDDVDVSASRKYSSTQRCMSSSSISRVRVVVVVVAAASAAAAMLLVVVGRHEAISNKPGWGIECGMSGEGLTTARPQKPRLGLAISSISL